MAAGGALIDLRNYGMESTVSKAHALNFPENGHNTLEMISVLCA